MYIASSGRTERTIYIYAELYTDERDGLWHFVVLGCKSRRKADGTMRLSRYTRWQTGPSIQLHASESNNRVIGHRLPRR